MFNLGPYNMAVVKSLAELSRIYPKIMVTLKDRQPLKLGLVFPLKTIGKMIFLNKISTYLYSKR